MTRRKTWLIAGAVVVVLAVVGALVWTNRSQPDAVASSAPSVTPASASSSASPSPTGVASTATEFHPGDIIATASKEIKVFAKPGGTKATHKLSPWSYYGKPLTLLATGTDTVDGKQWLHVLLPVQPNGTDGWIRADDVTVSSTDVEVRIYLAEHELDVLKGGDVKFTIKIAVGADKTPTPLGLFYVTDPLDFTANPTGKYGAYAIGISGFSEVLDSFDGGPPQIAMHGTNKPALIGQNVSNGCLRMANDDVLKLKDAVDLGTPVYIAESRQP